MAKFVLTTPITVNGDEVSEIELRTVNVNDYVALGPVMIANVNPKTMKTSVIEDPKVILNYIVRLTGLTAKEISSMDIKDFLRLGAQIKKDLDFTDDTDSTI